MGTWRMRGAVMLGGGCGVLILAGEWTEFRAREGPKFVKNLQTDPVFPFSGVMTAVIVIGDPLWAAVAAATYPEADIYLM